MNIWISKYPVFGAALRDLMQAIKTMSKQELVEMEALCRPLALGGDLGIRWSWDARLGAVLMTFTSDKAAAFQAFLSIHLPFNFDRGTLHKAPEPARKLVVSIGGVRLDQKIVCSDVSKPLLVLGAWWPWGGGQTISVRLFPIINDQPGPDTDTLVAAFKSWFGL